MPDHKITFTYLSQEDLLKAGCFDIRMAMEVAEKTMLAFEEHRILFPEKIIQIFDKFFPAYIFALPQGGQVVAGQADITTPNAQNMQINQATQMAIINWQRFSIAAPEAVNFAQPNAAAIALNRVVGVDPSLIYGSLSANGNIWVINPNGLLVGATGKINVNSFTASTNTAVSLV